MLIPSCSAWRDMADPSLSRRVNANSQLEQLREVAGLKLIKKGEC